ncbi:MAG TPA: DUF72 domain-containing protein [Flavobacterium sp.]|nr:DUF72 domain-containing protein [Flavobacterium sp.]
MHIGTSGWHYKHWLGTFYPEGTKADQQFPYYLSKFNTVEINNSFYRLPTIETFQHWRDAVPDDFLYAVKASRFITHMKKLIDPVQSSSRFFENVIGLGDKLGPILFQLPPGWNLNIDRLKDFVEKLPTQFRYVFEFRNQTWYTNEVFELLGKHNCAFCIYDLAGHMTPLVDTANFVYVRLHGPGDKYQGSYTEEALKEWAFKCQQWLISKDVFVYFDNDIGSHAPFNALTLRKLII